MTDRDIQKDRLIRLLRIVNNMRLMRKGFTECADYLLANGVIVSPCKVGDMVYDICTIFDESTLKAKTIIKPRIIDFVSKVGFIIESKGLVLGEKDFGKTVFLTKEEAEAKLKECE